ncbi:MAG: hypothetical protein E6J63_11285 [Deltaproteobacteria bacterium]|nr:MAG: hypothetical protein E6J63_11285 [Deltaproteobacteria bacterium]
MTFLFCAVLAAAMPPPIVEGRVSEAGGAGAAFAQVTLAQGDHVQVVRTRPDGWFRFRAFEGAGTLTVKLPQGWTAEALTREVGPALRGDVIRADFLATARRVLRGRLLVAGAPLPEVRLSAGPASASTDARGLFVLEGLPGGVVDVRVDAPPLAGRVELPAGPADVARDVSVSVPDFGSLRVSRVPQDSFERPISDWLASKRLGVPEIGRMERLAALVGLDPAFRLAMVAPSREAARGAQAAAVLQRYLTGPALVPRERVLFAVAEFTKPGHLELLLTRIEEPR